MYSLILMTAMTSAPQGPQFGGYFRDLFNGCGGCAGSCTGQSNACYGSCTGSTFGSRVRAFFSFGGCTGCTGCYGSCTGRSAGCFGASYSCHGCSGSVPYAGPALDGYPAPPDYGVPTYPTAPPFDASPFAPAVPGAIPPVRGPGTDGVPFAPITPAPPAVIDDRNAFRTTPGGGTRATVVVKLPADAKLYAEGRLLPLASAERTFVTPELPAGRDYAYTFKVEYDRNGETVSQAKRVSVRPGTTTPVEFSDLVMAKAAAPAPKPAATANTTATKTSDESAPAAAKDGGGNPFKASGSAAPAGERARITVKLPPGATLYIDDKKKDGTSAVREFTTPPLPPGKEFAYLVKVEVVRDGLPEHLFEKVVFRAGEVVTRDFATLLPGDRRAGK